MPASNQPDDTSVTCSPCLRSAGAPQAEVNAASIVNATSVVRRIIRGFYDTEQHGTTRIGGLELPKLDLCARFLLGEPASKIV